jgi:hypothetical protein
MKNKTHKKTKGGIFGLFNKAQSSAQSTPKTRFNLFSKPSIKSPQSNDFGMKEVKDFEYDDDMTDVSSDRSSSESFGPSTESFGPSSESFGPSTESFESDKMSYSWESFIKRASNNIFLDSLVSDRIKYDRVSKQSLNVVRAQIALLHAIITGGDDLYQSRDVKTYMALGETGTLNIPDDYKPEHICSKHPEIIETYADASPKIKSLMCAFSEIAYYFRSDPTSFPPEGNNIFHFLALATIESRGVGVKSKASSFLRSGLTRGVETQSKVRDAELMKPVLDFLCENTTPPDQTYPSRLKQFLMSNDGIQQMLSAANDAGKTPFDIVKSVPVYSANKCFITNIYNPTSGEQFKSQLYGGKSRRNLKQAKKTRKSKKSKKTRKASRK